MADLHIGFTGTRKGMTRQQRGSLQRLLYARSPQWLHHGMCVGADEQAHHLALIGGIQIEGHPPACQALMATDLVCDVLNDPRPYLERNRMIVQATDELIAAPAEFSDPKKGGTWFTIRYARSLGRRVTVIWPDGLLHTTPIYDIQERT